MKLQPLSPMIGFQAVQPAYAPLFSAASVASPASFHAARPPPSLLDCFPGLGGDGLRVSWAHAVNSRARLAAALRGASCLPA